ncbi:MAG: SelB C-terminal domain-containing protein, partial [Pseudomonadota bacterium]
EWVFDPAVWDDLQQRIEDAVAAFHELKPERSGANVRDIQLSLNPYVEKAILEEAISSLLGCGRLYRRGVLVHLPNHDFKVSDNDRALCLQAASYLAPDAGSPMSLHQAADAMNVGKRALEKALKQGVGLGEMVAISRNRYITAGYLWRMAQYAEELASESHLDGFTVAGYCEKTPIGRNFAIDLLEYFDKKGFTYRSRNIRKIRKPAIEVFANNFAP